jgi:AMMECR1 domain-containing protein
MKFKHTYKKAVYGIALIFALSVMAHADSMHSPLTSVEERSLIRYARNVLQATVEGGAKAPLTPMPAAAGAPLTSGMFVTLVKNNQVRGCYGSLFLQGEKLYEQIREYIMAAATSDFRHSPVRASELSDIVIIISFIGPIEPVASISEIDPKVDGLLLRDGSKTAVLLPGEARTASWQIKEAKRQAGLQAGETAELFRIHTATLYER